MKKFWKILNSSDIENCLLRLHVNSNYIKVLLEEDSDFMNYLNKNNPKYVHICQSDINGNPSDRFDGFGWGREDDLEFFLSYNCKFCGTIDLRKEKLKKLSGKFRENI